MTPDEATVIVKRCNFELFIDEPIMQPPFPPLPLLPSPPLPMSIVTTLTPVSPASMMMATRKTLLLQPLRLRLRRVSCVNQNNSRPLEPRGVGRGRCNMKLDDLVYVGLLGASIGFGQVYRRIQNLEVRQWTGTVLGLAMTAAVSGWHTLHPIFLTGVNVLILNYVSKRLCHVVSFWFSFGYLLFFRLSHYAGLEWFLRTLMLCR
ncbi:Lysophospholipid acyltransferase 7 [Chionoecetes opilio]|uniref:Lysophospholipid acyltransferase 7 n=1 Tax=Chionoecetes opilio TaxID=41210 RepID=A0A8J4YMG4_CHIOP|nr:Lysophospholipid acyltransferase 7 [Chionoecetes opilio]